MKTFIHSVIFAISAILLFNVELLAQKDLVISGGNSVSSYVCSNMKVTVWGNHYGSSPQSITVGPGTGVNIKQVNSGSGSHFVALACDGTVWAWGNNSKGQCGNGTVPNAEGTWEATPAQVKASAGIDAAYKDAGGNLINAAVVYAGNNSSFAILDNGDLVSWGGNSAGFNGAGYDNSSGQLGDGTTTDRGTASYVLTGPGQRLRNVVEIYAGDNIAMALTSDGTVYTWGHGLNGTLARNAAGTGNPSTATVNNAATVDDTYARPAYYAGRDGSGTGPMNNIVHISCGDVFGLALDVNGYVWAWGNGGWNNSTGNVNNPTTSAPQKVLAGSTTGASNDGKYLLAKQIGAGQGFGMAVTADNKPVAWGGGGCGDGGATGNGTLTGQPDGKATYIQYGPNQVHNDVILINRGDTWGFYGRSDGTMWAWGCNNDGQLGIGNMTNQARAVPITLPAGCGLKDPKPEIEITPKSMTVCQSKFTNQVLNSNFNSTTALASYRITWYRNGSQVQQGYANVAANQRYTATQDGTYRVVVEYTGNNNGCDTYESVKDSMTISFFPQQFEAPTDLTYCGNDSATVNVKAKAPYTAANIAKKVYNWYPTMTATAALGTSTGTGTAKINMAGVAATAGTPPTKTVYVEEIAGAAGTVLKRTLGTCTTTGSDLNLNNGPIAHAGAKTYAGFTVYEEITITELSFLFMSSIYTAGQSGTATITMGIYRAGVNNGNPVPTGTPIGTLVATYNRTRGAEAQDLLVTLTATGSVTLTSGEYFIGPSAYNSTGNLQNAKLYSTTCAYGNNDDVNGNIIRHNLGVAANNNGNQTGNDGRSMVFDIKFRTAQQFCDRIPVVLKEDCPCKSPKDIVISSSVTPTGTGAGRTVSLCPGESTTLTTNNIGLTAPVYNNFTIRWYKGNKTTTTGTAADPGVTATPLTVAYANSGTTVITEKYYVQVIDKAMPTATSCYKWDSITVVHNLPPHVNHIPNQSICSGGSTTAVTLSSTLAGTTTYSWKTTVSGVTGLTTATGTTAAIPSETLTAGGTTSGTVTYTITPTLAGCTGPDSTFTVTVKPLPSVNHIPNQSICSGGSTTAVTLSSTLAGTTTYSWKTTVSGVTGLTTATGTTAAIPSEILTAGGTTSGTVTYTITPTLAGCTGPDSTFTVTVKPLPSVNHIPNQSICSGGSTTAVTLTSTLGGTTYSWKTTVSGVTGLTTATGTTAAIPSETLTAGGTTSGTVTYTITPTLAGCTGPDSTFTVTVNPLPSVNHIPNQSICSGGSTTAVTLSSTLAGTTTYSWKTTVSGVTGLTTATGTTAAIPSETLTAGGTTSGTVTYAITPTLAGCTGPDSTFTVTVKPVPNVNSIANQSICSGGSTTAVTLTSTLAGTTYSWKTTVSGVTGLTTATGTTAAIPSETLTAGGTTSGTVTYTITPALDGCTGPDSTFTVTVKPLPSVNHIPNQSICSGGSTTAVTLTSTLAGTIYSWKTTVSGVTGLTTATGTTAAIPSETLTAGGTTSGTVTYTITPTLAGCTGPDSTFTVTVKPVPNVNSIANQSICSGGSTTAVTLSSTLAGTTTYSWKTTVSGVTGLTTATGTTAAIPSETLTAGGTTSGTVTYTITPTLAGCTGPDSTFTVTVKPLPSVNHIPNQSICSGGSTTAVTLSSTLAGTTTYSWKTTVSGVTGLTTATGTTAAIPSETLTAGGTTSGTVTYTITPTLAGCTGPDSTFTVTVKPLPSVNHIPNQSICSGGSTTAVTLSSTLAGTTTYSWKTTVSGVTGLTTATGTTAAIPSEILTAGGTTSGTVTYTITPTLAGCTGPDSTFTVTVKPLPSVNHIPNQSICSGGSTTAVTLTSTLGGTTYSWKTTVSGVTGLTTATGTTAAIPSETLTAGGTTSGTVTYTITPTLAGCTGPDSTFTVTVNPLPTETLTDPSAFCSGTLSTNPSKTIAGNTITWYKSDGLTAAAAPDEKSLSAAGSPYTFYYKVENTTTSCISVVHEYKVTVDTTTAPTVNHDILYFISDTLANGKFKDLLSQDGAAITAGTGYALIWYDENQTIIGTGSTPPTPTVPSADATLTYYVSRKPTSGTPVCESEKVKVTVKIYLAPVPTVTTLSYCEGAESHESDFAADLQEAVSINTSQGALSDYTLLWYKTADSPEIGTTSPTVSSLTGAPGQSIVYYVTQKHNVTHAESSRVAVEVKVYGVKPPTVTGNTLSYCIHETPLSLQAQKVADNTNYYYADNLVWTLNGIGQASQPTVNTGSVDTTHFGVYQTYQISGGDLCQGDTTFFDVTVNRTDVPTGDLTVNYLKSEGVSPNTFDNILKKNPNVALVTSGCMTCTLIWFDENENLSGTGGSVPPTPTIDPSLSSGQDQTITYYVLQKNSVTGCISDTVSITVIISDTPMPKVNPLAYCEGETPSDLRNFTFSGNRKLAVINEDIMPAGNYKLLWYSEDPKKNPSATPLSDPINLNMTVPSGQSKRDTVYYVTQERTDIVDTNGKGAESSASLVRITAYAKPAFAVTNPAPLCETVIDITASWDITNGYVKTDLLDKYYQDAAGTQAIPTPKSVTKNGQSYIQLTYNLQADKYYGQPTCNSIIQPVNVRIDTLTIVPIIGSNTACPGTQVKMSAAFTTNVAGIISYTWSGDLGGTPSQSGNSEFLTNAVSTVVGQEYNFTVKAAAGVCTKDSQPHKVTVGDGPVVGTMTISEQNKPGKTVTFTDGETRVFYTCGNDFDITTSYQRTKNDFVWTDGTGTQIATGATLPTRSLSEGKAVYTLSYTNQCPTSAAITVYSVPVSATSDMVKMQLCENEGFKTTLSISLNDPEGLSHRQITWYHDGYPIIGETGTTYRIAQAQPSNSGVYTYEVNNRGCVATDTVRGLSVTGVSGISRLDVSSRVAADILPISAVCEGSTITLGFASISPITSIINWEDPQNTIISAKDGWTVDAVPLFKPNGTHQSVYTYNVSATNVYCRMDTVVSVFVNDSLTGTISASDICEGQSVTLDAGSYEATNYEWTSNAYAGMKYGSSQIEMPAQTSLYTVLISRGACEKKDSVTVNVNTKPKIHYIDSTGMRDRNIILVDGLGTPPFLYGVDDREMTDYSRKYDLTFGKHTFYVEDALGCQSQAYKYLLEAPKIYPPNYFSPNGDGIGDTWEVANLREAYPDAVVTIYDRYGKKLIEYKGSDMGWNGAYDGHDMPSTDYWYVIKIDEIDEQYVGHFTLIRR